jgi:hypothetical protein
MIADRMRAAGSKPSTPRGRDEDLVMPVPAWASTGDPKSGSPDVAAVAPVPGADLFFRDKESAFARRSLRSALDAGR